MLKRLPPVQIPEHQVQRVMIDEGHVRGNGDIVVDPDKFRIGRELSRLLEDILPQRREDPVLPKVFQPCPAGGQEIKMQLPEKLFSLVHLSTLVHLNYITILNRINNKN